jgi:hypothetical protein
MLLLQTYGDGDACTSWRNGAYFLLVVPFGVRVQNCVCGSCLSAAAFSAKKPLPRVDVNAAGNGLARQ